MLRSGTRLLADDSGRFVLRARRAENVLLNVRRIGYRPGSVTVGAGGDTTVAVALIPTAQVLAAAEVRVTPVSRKLELNGYYRRLQDREKGINAGHFITEEEIEQRNPMRITQMLDGLPGVRVMRINTGSDQTLMRKAGGATTCMSHSDPRCWVPVGASGCPMMVYIDGRRVNDISTLSNRNNYAVGTDESAPPSHVAGIEVYSSAGRVPPEYQSLGGTCGAVLIWTK
jgi:hypothetical protein